MHILVTNDDGIHAPGLLALVQAAKPFGKVSVIAPDHNWSVSGHVKTLHRSLKVFPEELADGTPALATDGAPSDCVAMALLGLLEEKVDLVLSGVNPYPNVGHDLTYSGTVTAAMEAAIWGVRGIAFSQDSPPNKGKTADYSTTTRAASVLLEQVLKDPLPTHIILNVNVPYLPWEQVKGFRVTRQGERVYHDWLERQADEQGEARYLITGEYPTGIPHQGTDIGALAAGYVSVMPVHLDMTAHEWLDPLRRWPIISSD